MIAALWLLLAVFAGWQLCRLSLGDLTGLVDTMGSPATATPFCRSSWAVLMLRLAMATTVGLLILSWLTYGLAALLSSILPLTVHPLLPTNLLVLLSLAAWAAFSAYRNRHTLGDHWPGRIRALRHRTGVFTLCVTLTWVGFAAWLMFSTFFRLGNQVHAGYSVFSDFAPHTALISSFSQGRNWPTTYPHFPNDGMSYHFMFFFLCGNLHYLGLPIDWAINLPSILTFTSFCLLLGYLAVRLTGRTAAYLLAPALLFLRSSTAFFTNLAEWTEVYGISPRSWGILLQNLWRQSSFIGNTPRDEWGLWGINVYANQRHLLSGLALLLIVLILVLPDLQTGLRLGRRSWTSLDGWVLRTPAAAKRYGIALLICLFLPYWHGSALVSLLLVLLPLAFFTMHRLGLLLLALGSVGSALLQSWFFSGEATRVVQPAWYFGFIAADRSAAGVLVYLLTVTGLALPLLAISFWLPGWRRKILISAFMLPLVFALTVSLTPDVTVNHKYIIVALALANLFLADLLIRLWQPRSKASLIPDRPADRQSVVPVWLTRVLACLLASLLMVTGLHEIRIVRNINQNSVSIDSRSPLVVWIKEHAQPNAVFVSTPYHYHAFFLSGRAIWFGHSYYAWSAGHDTGHRFEQLRRFLSGSDGDLTAVHTLIQAEQLDYLMVDDALRSNEDLWVDETFFSSHFALAASFPELGNLKVYDLRRDS